MLSLQISKSLSNLPGKLFGCAPRRFRFFFRTDNLLAHPETIVSVTFQRLGRKFHDDGSISHDDDNDIGSPLIDDPNHVEMTRTVFPIPGAGLKIFLIQPRLKGASRTSSMAVQSQLNEAVVLAETIRNWKVIGKVTATTNSISREKVFGSGNLEALKIEVDIQKEQLSAIFVNVGQLTGVQQNELQTFFGLTILDRYSVVLQIFREHTRTKVSKLQVALAEIPYIRSRLQFEKGPGHGKMSSGTRYIGGSGETYLELRRRLLDERELKLKRALKKVSEQREIFRKQRGKKELPVIAVVGYTNSGKTSLIKALTGDHKMQPVNQLFATLDVTAHGGLLPSRMPVIYVDTVGFISDIPTQLVASFASTLEDAVQADVIVHIRDVSHPDTEQQRLCVLETLRQIRVPDKIYENIIEVGNKIDLLNVEQPTGEYLPVSATNGRGLSVLLSKVEELLLETTNRRARTFHVPNGGDEYKWLYKEGAVGHITPDSDDGQLVFIQVILSQSALNKFRYKFGNLEVSD